MPRWRFSDIPVGCRPDGCSVVFMHRMETPIGPLWLETDGAGLSSVAFHGPPGGRSDEPVLREAEAQLRAYFAGELTRFELPLSPHGTDFQRRVWDAVAEVAYGTTTSYSAIAAEVGRPNASRAVGAANGRNPLAIVIPCHRIVGAAGALTGYGGGLERKRMLLDLEAAAG